MISTEVDSTIHNTYDVIVLATDGLLGASAVASNADDGERRALETNLTNEALYRDTKEPKEGGARSGVVLRFRKLEIVADH